MPEWTSLQAVAHAHHGDGITEAACNFSDPGRVEAAEVHLKIVRLSGNEGLTVVKGRFTDFFLWSSN